MNYHQNSPLVELPSKSRVTDMISLRSQFATMVAVFVLTSGYAVARYNFFGDVSPANIPTYILNKSISMSSVVFLLLSGWRQAQGHKQIAKFWGTSSLHFAMVHIAMSVVMLSESYYAKLYSDGKMNLNGEACILFGVLAIYCYLLLSASAQRHLFAIIKCLAASAICLHLFFMGYIGWFKTADWPGQLPPISLISFLIGIAALAIYLRLLIRERQRG